MNKLFVYVATAAVALTGFFTSCSDDDDAIKEQEQKALVQFSAKPMVEGALDIEDLEGMLVVFTEVRNQDTTHCVLNNQGVGTVNLTKGTYNISIEEKLTNEQGAEVVVSVRMENVSINQSNQEIVGKVNSLPANAIGKNFIFSEIFFNGERNSGRMMHPDQYIVVFNPTQDTLYADGLSVGVTQHLSWQDKQMWYDEYYSANKVPVGGFITVPGNGTEHPIAPGDRFVIAFTAVDHSKVEGYDHAVDLSGADFEVYYGPDTKDIDNPEVPNVVVTENGDSFGFFFQPRGYVSPLMFKLENGEASTIEKFYKSNLSRTKTLIPADEEKGTPEEIIEINIFSLPVDQIIDGVQTSDVPQDVKTRVVPEVVDRGKFLVNGCHRQELAIRKEIKVGNKVFYQDTNNSSEDFVPVNERKEQGLVQNAFPIGWRNK